MSSGEALISAYVKGGVLGTKLEKDFWRKFFLVGIESYENFFLGGSLEQRNGPLGFSWDPASQKFSLSLGQCNLSPNSCEASKQSFGIIQVFCFTVGFHHTCMPSGIIPVCVFSITAFETCVSSPENPNRFRRARACSQVPLAARDRGCCSSPLTRARSEQQISQSDRSIRTWKGKKKKKRIDVEPGRQVPRRPYVVKTNALKTIDSADWSVTAINDVEQLIETV